MACQLVLCVLIFAAISTLSLIKTEDAHVPEDMVSRCQEAKVTEKDVIDLVMKGYNKQSRPKKDGSETVTVSVGLSLFGIRDFVERENSLILDGYISLLWNDDFLQWSNSFPHSCIPYMYMDADLVWTPNLSFMSGMLDSDPALYPAKGVKVSATSDGSMELYPMGKMQVRCDLRLEMFPFDEQVCSVMLESWTYPNTMQALLLYTPSNTSAFARVDNIWTENEQWEIADNRSDIVHPMYFPNNSQVFDRALFTLKIRRKSMFYRVHVIAPSIIIGFVEVVTFVLPITEVIKIHISFTCLLAYSVFQDMVMKDMPRSQTTPLLSIYINLQMAYIGLIAILGEGIIFMIIRQAQFKKVPPPKVLLRVSRTIGSVIFYECHRTRQLAKVAMDQPTQCESTTFALRQSSDDALVNKEGPYLANGNANGKVLTGDQTNVMRNRGHSAHGIREGSSSHETPTTDDSHYTDSMSPRNQWLFIAEVIERINMFFYLLAVCLTPAMMFTIAGASQRDEPLPSGSKTVEINP